MSRKHYIGLAAAVLIGLLLVVGRYNLLVVLLWMRGGKHIERQAAVIPIHIEAPAVEELPLKLDATETIKRSRGIPHGPVFGEDSYQLDGTVLLHDRSIPIHTLTYRPRALIRLGGQYLLLTRHYFSPSAFAWLRSNGQEAFEAISVGEVPEETWVLKVGDDLDTYYYRAWLLNSLANSASGATVLSCLSTLLRVSPRFAYRQDWLQDRDTQIVDFLNHFVGEKKPAGFYDQIRTLLFASQPGDDDQVIEFACWALLALDPERARQDTCAYRARIKQDAIPDDTRALPFQGSDFRDIDCTKLATQPSTLLSTQPTR